MIHLRLSLYDDLVKLRQEMKLRVLSPCEISAYQNFHTDIRAHALNIHKSSVHSIEYVSFIFFYGLLF